MKLGKYNSFRSSFYGVICILALNTLIPYTASARLVPDRAVEEYKLNKAKEGDIGDKVEYLSEDFPRNLSNLLDDEQTILDALRENLYEKSNSIVRVKLIAKNNTSI